MSDRYGIITPVTDSPDRRFADDTRVDEPTGEILVPLVAADTGPAREWAEAADHDKVASPTELDAGPTHLNVARTFCFADLSGFTAFTREHGPHEAVQRLGEFRRITRNVAAKRGVRVAKWLGDGVMLVGTEPTPTIAAGAHLIHHFNARSTDLRVGIATGVALLVEGHLERFEAAGLPDELERLRAIAFAERFEQVG
jgi:class 3 adenylate cyclase